jgi:hypothetical protein
MKTPKFYLFTLFVLTLLSINIYSQEVLPTKEGMELQSLQGTVTAINPETREITLMGSQGDLTTITAGEEIERFDEISIGDAIIFDLYTYMKAEFREPTAEEIAEPLVVVEKAAKANEETMPAGAIGAMVKAVVTIEVLNRVYMQATVKGPRGNYLTIDMEDEDLIQKLHIGQVVILTYAEAMAISLEKISK